MVYSIQLLGGAPVAAIARIEWPNARDPATCRIPLGIEESSPPSRSQAPSPARLTVRSPAEYWPQVGAAADL